MQISINEFRRRYKGLKFQEESWPSVPCRRCPDLDLKTTLWVELGSKTYALVSINVFDDCL